LKDDPQPGSWRGFIHSNLFTSLVIWLLGQGVLVAGFLVSTYYKNSSTWEWRGQVDARMKRMDEQGTIHSHYAIEEADKEISRIDERLKRVEEDTRNIKVWESENRRLTRDVEELKAERH